MNLGALKYVENSSGDYAGLSDMGYSFYQFTLKRPSVTIIDGQLVTNLPNIDNNIVSELTDTATLAVTNPTSKDPTFCEPHPITAGSSAKPSPCDQTSAPYLNTSLLSSTMTLTGIEPFLESARLEVNLPSTGVVVGNDFVWTGTIQLHPFLSATNIDTAEQWSRYEFLSGIAFATAAAALIALLQERPRRRPSIPPLDPTPLLTNAPLPVLTESSLPSPPEPVTEPVVTVQPESKQTLESGIAIGLGIATAFALIRKILRR